jgi:K+-sensing histidine kinase KdpD
VDLSALAHELAGVLRNTEPHREVEFVIQRGLSARGDAALLRLILGNLLSNAWKFTSKRTRARIELGARKLDSGVMEYVVRDNGVGLDASRLTLPPQAFARQHCEQGFEGVGLGLTIVYRALRRLDGSLRAEGHPNAGAAFFFTIGTTQNTHQ